MCKHWNSRGGGTDAPTIGHHSYIGPGAKLFGKIIIGDNCAIGANAVVNKSFLEDGLNIAGAKIISRKGTYDLIKIGRTKDENNG